MNDKKIRRLLLENKIDKERIFLEDKSKNTMENFIFSDKLYNLSERFRNIAEYPFIWYNNFGNKYEQKPLSDIIFINHNFFFVR